MIKRKKKSNLYSKKNINENPYQNLNDLDFALILGQRMQQVPIWKKCSKKEYDESCVVIEPDESGKYDPNKLLKAMANVGEYRKVPIYEDELNYYKSKIIGYKYYKKAGYKNIVVCGAQEAKYIRERMDKNDNTRR